MTNTMRKNKAELGGKGGAILSRVVREVLFLSRKDCSGVSEDKAGEAEVE